jgi:hypothetical protein
LPRPSHPDFITRTKLSSSLCRFHCLEDET